MAGEKEREGRERGGRCELREGGTWKRDDVPVSSSPAALESARNSSRSLFWRGKISESLIYLVCS